MEHKVTKRFRFAGVENRIGIVAEILEAIAAQGLSITAVELEPGCVSVELEWEDRFSSNGFCKCLERTVKGFDGVEEIKMMDYQKRRRELELIIDNIDEAVLALDEQGNVQYFNRRASQLFGLLRDGNKPDLGKILPDRLNALPEGDYVEVTIRGPRYSTRALARVCKIRNEEGREVGSLLIVREMQDVRQLIQSTTGSVMVDFPDIVGRNPRFLDALGLARTFAPTNLSIILRGETGTGKELFARAIHANSARKNGPFVAINCAAVPDNLLESEFFGYERGAFTGATLRGKQGLFEQATHGTLFLDEIGDLSPHLQAKILRAIEEQKIRRLGGRQEIPIDVRLISATDKDLEHMIREGSFRPDLFYRLAGISIFIPPLRERPDDIPLLVEHFLATIGEKLGKTGIAITSRALEKLLRHSWPGNVRELRNVVERAIVLGEGEIDDTHIIIETEQPTHQPRNWQISFPTDLPALLREIENQYLREACRLFSSSRKIARALGLSHTAVINKMRRLGVSPDAASRRYQQDL